MRCIPAIHEFDDIGVLLLRLMTRHMTSYDMSFPNKMTWFCTYRWA